MIPDYYNTDEPCHTTSHGEKESRHSRRECFFQTWREAPLPWVKAPGPPTLYDRTGAHRYHLICPGIRIDTGRAQIWCNRGIAPGPYIWRECPPDRAVDRESACAHCLSHWLREEANVTVTYTKSTAIRVKKGQLVKLLEAVGGTDLMDGIRLIVDPTIPPNRLEFRNTDGNVVQTVDLPEIEFELPKPALDPIAFEEAFKARWWRRRWP